MPHRIVAPDQANPDRCLPAKKRPRLTQGRGFLRRPFFLCPGRDHRQFGSSGGASDRSTGHNLARSLFLGGQMPFQDWPGFTCFQLRISNTSSHLRDGNWSRSTRTPTQDVEWFNRRVILAYCRHNLIWQYVPIWEENLLLSLGSRWLVRITCILLATLCDAFINPWKEMFVQGFMGSQFLKQ